MIAINCPHGKIKDGECVFCHYPIIEKKMSTNPKTIAYQKIIKTLKNN